MDDHELFEVVRTFLSQWRTASLATVDEAGQPHAANVQFVADHDLSLYFVSNLGSAHSRHIAMDPRAAMTIYAHTSEEAGPAAIHGLQLHGQCFAITSEVERMAATKFYLNRFTFIAQNEALAARVKAEQFYVFRPTWLRWIDNRRGFGFKEERTLVT